MSAEIIVVDSGSTDATLEMAERFADRVVEVEPAAFTYGGTLNAGAAVADSDVLVALSSHCTFDDVDWLTLAAETVRQADVHGACGGLADGEGRRLVAPFEAGYDYLVEHPSWGFSNHASAWSAESWASAPFDEHLQASEDKEWSWRATAQGGVVVIDPRLVVGGVHRRSQGERAYFQRVRREVLALDALKPLPRFSILAATRQLVATRPTDPFVTQSRPLGRTRALEVAARWSGGRAAGRRA